LKKTTVQLKWPFGQTLGLAILLFSLLLGGFELFVRTEFVRSRLNTPTIGSRHGQFENQLARLERVVEREGPVDCIFLGSSLVWLGVEPETFTQAYKLETGRDIRCFTFGISAMPASAAGPVAKILIHDYKPRLLIYGISARDFAFPIEAEDAAVILETPWVQYRVGHFTIQGWLYEHFYTLRYLLHFHRLLRFDFSPLENQFGTTPAEWYGFLPKNKPITDKSLASASEYAHEWLYNYKIWPDDLLGLEQVVQQNDQDVQIIILEMPVPPAHFAYFKNGRSDFEQYVTKVENIVASSQVPFWRTTDLQLIPAEDWWDPSHLNVRGAKIFSEWLGHHVGEAVNQGTISIKGPARERKF
jgi:hypothetical protein